ncbi:phosphatidyl-N-methylethanolamine N-methyltransferase [[Candida] railenensis]|uniref:Phosphatidyl-N-methylethanolamine N-methyltransferase n=1 Tax=[Candida] railenensis TaxID=45579 RepID=A0A9P0VXB9_9ASCO|nr:phosphatidyl-N-methylethanolamine N-methyltransferase [[Candida] railenensis]
MSYITASIDDLKYLYSNGSKFVDFSKPDIVFAIQSIAFNPIFWNIVARLEYKTHFLTKVAGGARNGCYLLALTIFSLGIFRDHVYFNALQNQPTYEPFLTNPVFQAIAIASFGFGNILVLTSMYALGVTGTYLGDYFGILMDDRVTGFPFNINDNPMYNGSTLCFLGTALWYGKPTGLVVTFIVHGFYKLALFFEEPFTAKIYAKREEARSKKQE